MGRGVQKTIGFTFILALMLFKIHVASAKESAFEITGDILQVAIPATAYLSTFYMDDKKGRTQFYYSFCTNIGKWGYPDIVILMALESSFFPFPSEVVIPPAAYLAATGKMNIGMVVLCGTLGSLLGAVFNYWLAMKFGRPFFERYGRYLLVSRQSLEKADRFFNAMGISAPL
jgi:hypothetical protein